MSAHAIVVEKLGKRYRIGRRGRPEKTFREVVADTVTYPVRRLRELGGRADRGGIGDEHFWAIRDVSFDVRPGEVVGIIGRNGAGKSTLLKVLSRITEPTEGRAVLRGRLASLLEVGTGFHRELTGRENTYLNGAIMGMRRAEIDRKFDEIVAFAEVEKFIDTPVKHYSSGMYVRLAFAVAAHLEPEILLVDEVLAVGDAEFQRKCLGRMQDVAHEGRTVFFVSHNMAAIARLCDRALFLRNGRLAYSGPAAEAIRLYQEDVARAGSRNREPHVIYDAATDDTPARGDFRIMRVEVLSPDGTPLPLLSTWDRATFRITYQAKHAVECGSVAFKISTLYGVPVVYTSTQPDCCVPMIIREGTHTVDCTFDSLPLTGGEYVVAVGLAVPNREWLCLREDLGTFTVHPRDVYASGQAPVGSRCVVATPHEWSVS